MLRYFAFFLDETDLQNNQYFGAYSDTETHVIVRIHSGVHSIVLVTLLCSTEIMLTSAD